MQFQLIHEVGNRQRWRTRTPLSLPSAQLIAEEIEAIKDVTGVRVNPRTGSVVVTYNTLEARSALAAYLASLATNPPLKRAARAHFLGTQTPKQRQLWTPDSRAGQAVEAINESRVVGGVRQAIDSGVRNMPLLTDIVYPILRVFGFRIENQQQRLAHQEEKAVA